MKSFKKVFNIIIDIIIYIVIVVMGAILVLIIIKFNQVFDSFIVTFLNWKNGLNFNNKNFLINDITFSIIYFVIDVIVCFSFGIIWAWIMMIITKFLKKLKFTL